MCTLRDISRQVVHFTTVIEVGTWDQITSWPCRTERRGLLLWTLPAVSPPADVSLSSLQLQKQTVIESVKQGDLQDLETVGKKSPIPHTLQHCNNFIIFRHIFGNLSSSIDYAGGGVVPQQQEHNLLKGSVWEQTNKQVSPSLPRLFFPWAQFRSVHMCTKPAMFPHNPTHPYMLASESFVVVERTKWCPLANLGQAMSELVFPPHKLHCNKITLFSPYFVSWVCKIQTRTCKNRRG